MVQRVVYNSCYGGFAFHEDVVKWVRENRDSLEENYSEDDVKEISDATISGEMYSDGSGPKGQHRDAVRPFDLSRDNELIVDIVSGRTEYDGRVNGDYSDLRVAEVPDGVSWTIDDYDGAETVELFVKNI